jgi:hypothetical protein
VSVESAFCAMNIVRDMVPPHHFMIAPHRGLLAKALQERVGDLRVPDSP